MSSAEPKFQKCSGRNYPTVAETNHKLPDYLPQKTALKSILDLYPGVTENYFGEEKLFSKIILPGKGKKPSSCRSWTPSFFCPNCGKPHFTKGNCRKSTCPDCEIDWRFRRCQAIMERILSQKIQRNLRCRHFVVSPSVEDYPETVEGLTNLRKEAYQFAKEKGVEGGVIIFHPFRILPAKKKELWAEIEAEDNEFKLWKKLLEKEWEEILKYLYWAPHFHIIALGKKGAKTFDSAELSDKFIWKGIGELSEASDLGKCAMYLLSHTGVMEKSHYNSITWFGSLSSSTWSLDRAVMRLRNGSTVKDFVLDLVEDFISNSHEELSGSLECDNCGSGLIHISSAPDYWEDRDLEFEAELKIAYGWWRGSIPPPDNLKSESDCWKYLKKLALEESEDFAFVSRMVKGRSCLEVVGPVEVIG